MESRTLKVKSNVENNASASNIITDNKFNAKRKIAGSMRNLTLTGNVKKNTDLSNTNFSTKENRPRSSSVSPPPTKRFLTSSNVSLRRHATTVNVIRSKKIQTNKTPSINQSTTLKSKVNSTISSKSGRKSIAAKVVVPKPSKWDWKGRLEVVNKQLIKLRKEDQELVINLKDIKEKVEQESKASWKEEFDKYKAESIELQKELHDLQEKLATEVQNNTLLLEKVNEVDRLYESTVKSEQEYKTRANIKKLKMNTIDKDTENKKAALISKTEMINVINDDVNSLKNCAFDVDSEISTLHNIVHNLKGNIRVFCRVRPKLEDERNKSLYSIIYQDECVISVSKDHSPEPSINRVKNNRKEFVFDKIFTPNVSQVEFFEEIIPFIQSAIKGYHVTVFLCGSNHSGKKYTLEGIPENDNKGMFHRMVEYIFKEKNKLELMGWTYQIKVTFLEIYNNCLLDLNTKSVICGADTENNAIEMKSPEDLLKMFLTAKQNQQDKRSHFIIQIQLNSNHMTKNESLCGIINLIILNTSLKKEEETGANITNEAQDLLEKSLLSLIYKQEDNIIHKESKLLEYLKPYFCEYSKILVSVHTSPLSEDYVESVNSMKFGNNIVNCRMSHAKKQKNN